MWVGEGGWVCWGLIQFAGQERIINSTCPPVGRYFEMSFELNCYTRLAGTLISKLNLKKLVAVPAELEKMLGEVHRTRALYKLSQIST